MDSVNKTFTVEQIRLLLNRARHLGVTKKESIELVQRAYEPTLFRSVKFCETTNPNSKRSPE